VSKDLANTIDWDARPRSVKSLPIVNPPITAQPQRHSRRGTLTFRSKTVDLDELRLCAVMIVERIQNRY
jgi:hypothetical protein